jgi:two-component system response regulator YesN
LARILIADDEDLERAALRFIICGSGLEPEFLIDEARNGHEALELGKSSMYDVMFLDIKMPGLDGLRTAEELRKAGILAPIVIISAFDTFEYAQKAIRLSVYEYLLKPASTDEVISALKRSLEWNREPESLFRKREESVFAISGAVRKLESSLVNQMKSGILDAAAVREYENLSSLAGLSRSAIVFRIHASPGVGTQTMGKALIDTVLTNAEKAAHRSRKIISAEAGDHSFMLIYGLVTDPGPSGRADGENSRSVPGGFLKNLRSDPLWPVMEEASRKLRDKVPYTMLCGLAGPSQEDADILVARAFEGSKLASSDCPSVRLAPLSRNNEDAIIHFSAADASPRSLGMKALDHIKSRYSREITLVSTAEEIGVNPFHLSHAISRELGIGFSELLRRIRINRAKELMIGGGSIKEASYLVGFSDQAYFTRVFKKLEGMNPTQFVEQTAKKYKK